MECTTCMATDKIGTLLKFSKDKNLLFFQKNAIEIGVIIHQIINDTVTVTGTLTVSTKNQMSTIKSFTPFGNDKLFLCTSDGQIFIYLVDKYDMSSKILSKNKVNSKMISVAEICPLGDYVMVCT